MKIGIITWFHYENYGTKLQAVALQRYLRKEGHHVELINFKLSDVLNVHNKRKKVSLFIRVLDKFKYELLKYELKRNENEIECRSKKFEEIISKYCFTTREIKSDEEYIKVCNSFDMLIFGSDQIWNPKWWHKYYYADFNEIYTKRIAYAPSMGVNYIPEEQVSDYQRSLVRFSHLSARETQGSKIIQDITGIETVTVVDPTLLLTYQDWNEIAGESKESDPYILCYYLKDNKNHWSAVRKYAKKKKMNLVVVPQEGFSFLQSGTIESTAGVDEFLALIRDAKMVLTDSFHATVFSLIFQKNFVVFERAKSEECLDQNSRIYNLLTELGLDSRIVKYNSSEIEDFGNITYDDVTGKLYELIKKSEEYLLSAVEKDF